MRYIEIFVTNDFFSIFWRTAALTNSFANYAFYCHSKQNAHTLKGIIVGLLYYFIYGLLC